MAQETNASFALPFISAHCQIVPTFSTPTEQVVTPLWPELPGDPQVDRLAVPGYGPYSGIEFKEVNDGNVGSAIRTAYRCGKGSTWVDQYFR